MSPFAIIFFALVSVPLVEIYLLVSVGRVIGAGTTILVVVFTAVLGAWLLRMQGLSTLQRIQHSTAEGKLPAQELIEGLILLVTGALLLTPGFFTDGIGFALLVPGIRAWCARRMITAGIYRVQTHGPGPKPGQRPGRRSGQQPGQQPGQRPETSSDPTKTRGSQTIEGEYYDADTEPNDSPSSSLGSDRETP